MQKHAYIVGSHVIIEFLLLKIVFAFANNVDPGEISRYHLRLHFLSKYSLRSHVPVYKSGGGGGVSRISGKGVEHVLKCGGSLC